MSIAEVSLVHLFGLRNDIPNNVFYCDDQNIIYPAGSTILTYNALHKHQTHFDELRKLRNLKNFALSQNKRYLAVSDSVDKPNIFIYDLSTSKRRKTLYCTEVQSKDVVSLSFSSDHKYVLVLGGSPDYTLVVYLWEKGKIVTTLKPNMPNAWAAVNQAVYNPADPAVIVVVGQHLLKMLRLTEGSLRQFGHQRVENTNYLCAAWAGQNRLLVGTDQGRVVLYDAAELKAEFRLSEAASREPTAEPERRSTSAARSSSVISSGGEPVTSIVTFSKGFVAVCGVGVAHVFDRAEDQTTEFYRLLRTVHIPQDPGRLAASADLQEGITGLAVSPSEETLVAASTRSQLYVIAMSSVFLTSKGADCLFEHLSTPFHYGSILDMDLSFRRPFAVTCGSDRTVAVWNHKTMTLDVYKQFQDDLHSVAIHPLGYSLLAGFSDKLRYMMILMNDLRPIKEFAIRSCTQCAFSNGGHLFAAVHGNVIQIYSTITFENVGNLKGHGGKIRALRWAPSDNRLVSCGMEGAIYEWDLQLGRRCGENVLRGCNYFSTAVSPDAKTIYAVGSDKLIKEVSDSQVIREVSCQDVVPTWVALSRSGRMLFLGLQSGVLRSVKFPLSIPGEWEEHFAHNDAITKMAVLADDSQMFTCSSDGTLALWQIQDPEGRLSKRERAIPYAEEILVSKVELDEKTRLINELNTRVSELRLENEYQLRLKDMTYGDKIRQLTERADQDIQTLNDTIESLKEENEADRDAHKQQLEDIRAQHQEEVQLLESNSNAKLIVEYEKYQALENKMAMMKEDYEKQLVDLAAADQAVLSAQAEEHEERIREKVALLEEAREEADQQKKTYEEMQVQIEEDGDREIVDIKTKYEYKLKAERNANVRLRGETGVMKKRFVSLTKELEEQRQEIQRLQGEHSKLQSIIKNLERDIIGLKKEVQERDETINEKEKRIYDLKKKNQELEKFKFVLDYKIKELKKQIEPREIEIKDMKETINAMENELENYHKKNTEQELQLQEFRQKLHAIEAELHRAVQRNFDFTVVMNRYRSDLFSCMDFIQDPKKLKESIKALYSKHVTSEIRPEKLLVDDSSLKEFSRQRDYLERTVAGLKHKLTKDTHLQRADNIRVVQENVALIAEINNLRAELHALRNSMDGLESALGLRRSSVTPAEAQAKLDKAIVRLDQLQEQQLQQLQARDQVIDAQRHELQLQASQIVQLQHELGKCLAKPDAFLQSLGEESDRA
ncbi:cilia- and flagella-associated protein 57-like [Pollicipes pollicipes]|uniref:cilia- and flagella-associated protein 57-like n=1 Tax=Pollicipes pollicipes TaxID=41117 RepID=UPI001884DDE3|nr:cilia- and flagella-associated protein 57-like [Pollicipes pollicipes]